MKTYIITGANSGLGFETAKRIAEEGHQVILACRNMEKGSIAAATIKSATGNGNIEARQLDLASLSSVREFAEGMKDTVIYALDNNAGIAGMKKGITDDGYDIVFHPSQGSHRSIARSIMSIDDIRLDLRNDLTDFKHSGQIGQLPQIRRGNASLTVNIMNRSSGYFPVRKGNHMDLMPTPGKIPAPLDYMGTGGRCQKTNPHPASLFISSSPALGMC